MRGPGRGAPTLALLQAPDRTFTDPGGPLGDSLEAPSAHRPLVHHALRLAERALDAAALQHAHDAAHADQVLDALREPFAGRVAVGASGRQRALDEHRHFIEVARPRDLHLVV